MIIGNNYTLKLFLNEIEIEILNDAFIEFRLIENLNFNIYTAKLSMRTNLWMDYPFMTGDNIKIIISIDEGKTENSYKFIIFNYNLYLNGITIDLVGKVFDDLYRKKLVKGYNNNISEILEIICNEVKMDYYIDNVDTEKRLFLQLNESYFYCLKYLIKYVENYYMFINKDNKFKFLNYDSITNHHIKAAVKFINMINLRIENNIYALQSKGGFGANGYYFDWNNGNVKTFDYIPEKYGFKTELVTKNNSIYMLDPIGNLYSSEKYVKNELKNNVLRKNMFKMFISFDIVGGNIDLTVFDRLSLEISKLIVIKPNDNFSGEWFIYEIQHIFDIQKYSSHIVCASPFFKYTNYSNFTV